MTQNWTAFPFIPFPDNRVWTMDNIQTLLALWFRYGFLAEEPRCGFFNPITQGHGTFVPQPIPLYRALQRADKEQRAAQRKRIEALLTLSNNEGLWER